MNINSQSSESNPPPEITYPWVGKHVDKNGPVVLFHAEFKGIVIDAGVTNDNQSFTVGKYFEGWGMSKFKEFKGTVKISSE